MDYKYTGNIVDVVNNMMHDIDKANISSPVVEEVRSLQAKKKTGDIADPILQYLAKLLWGLDEEAIEINHANDKTITVEPSADVFIPGVTYGPWNDSAPNRPQRKGLHVSTYSLKTTSMDFEVPATALDQNGEEKPVIPEWHKTDGRAPEGVYLTFPDGTKIELSVVALPASDGDEQNFVQQQRDALTSNGIDVIDSDSLWGNAIFIPKEGNELRAAFLFAPGDRWCVYCKLLFAEKDAMYEERFNEAEDIIESVTVHRGKEALAPYAAMDVSLVSWEGYDRK